ncbi:MAG: CoA-binding protein [Candidatus Helarchaeota archaeon]|nr:CoA-binding protein [Candidatus Helarchaeota archaeon]
METKDYMEKLFYPKSIAMIGASSKRIWQITGITGRKYEGTLYLVSENDDEILGIKCFRDISELPEYIDHAIIAVNRKKLVETIEKCIEKKVQTLHIFTAGASEYDKEGIKIEREVYDLIKSSEVRAIGPNCMGIYSPEGRYSYNPAFSEKAGSIALVSQSGDLTSQFVRKENFYGVYFSKAVSLGNSIDLTISDFVDYFSSDDKTEMITVYFEGFPHFDETEGKRLWNVLRKTKKPLLILRGGVSDRGKIAAASHTGTIATDDRIWESIYKQTSALKVNTYEELIDSTMAFYYCKELLPKMKSIVLVTWSGGFAVLSTDRIVELGVDVPEIASTTQEQMRNMISIGSVRNPLDLPWISRREKYPKICNLAINESYIGGIILETGTWDRLDERFNIYFNNLMNVFENTKRQGKPFLISLPYSHNFKQREKFKNRLLARGIPVFPSILRAAKAFLNLFKFYEQAKQFNLND